MVRPNRKSTGNVAATFCRGRTPLYEGIVNFEVGLRCPAAQRRGSAALPLKLNHKIAEVAFGQFQDGVVASLDVHGHGINVVLAFMRSGHFKGKTQ